MTADPSAFLAERPRLFGLAYRMLGSASEAEDVLQDAFLRLAGRDDVAAPRAWLTTVVTRLCLDRLKSARARREAYVGPWLPEPVVADDEPGVDPDTLSLGLLVLLERLSPVERAVFVLHEAFGLTMREIAGHVDKTEANCRKILERARAHLGEPSRFRADREQQERLLLGFVQACMTGDADAVAALFTDDATWTSDGGGRVAAARVPVVGAARIGKATIGILKLAPPDLRLTVAPINGQPALITWSGDRLYSVLQVFPRDGRIAAVVTVLNPDKLAALARQLNVPPANATATPRRDRPPRRADR